jgi:dTDP-4-dehydrorhamnose 3,5-epimerase
MIFTETALSGAYVIDIERREDNRGFFARIWCKDELDAHGLNTQIVQSNIGFSTRKGTLRGMHYQAAPFEEVKLVRCTHGAVYDVIVDLRPDSPTHKRWIGVELTAGNRRMLYVPAGFAHGYQTLTDDTELFYHTSQLYAPQAASGARYDDSAFGIAWPLPIQVISEADQCWPAYGN